MNDKPFDKMTHEERVDWATQYAFDGLIREGTRGLKSALWNVLTTYANYHRFELGRLEKALAECEKKVGT